MLSHLHMWALGPSKLCEGALGARSPAHVGTQGQQTMGGSTQCLAPASTTKTRNGEIGNKK